MSQVESSKCAVLIMHCQNDIVDPDGLYADSGAYAEVKRRDMLGHIAKVINFAHDKGIRIYYINNGFSKGYPELKGKILPICQASKESNSFLYGTWGTDVPEIIKPSEEDIVIRNTNTSAFSYTNLDQLLRAAGTETLYLTGCATNFVVDSTARYGSELGYDIRVIEDCCASWTQEMHEFEVEKILPQFGMVETSEDFFSEVI